MDEVNKLFSHVDTLCGEFEQHVAQQQNVSPESQQKYLEAAMRFFTALSTLEKQHTDPSTSKKFHYWCQYGRLMTWLLKLVANPQKHEVLVFFRQKALCFLGECPSCVDAYHEVCFGARLRIGSDPMLDALKKQDGARIHAFLSQDSISELVQGIGRSSSHALLLAIYEIVGFPDIFLLNEKVYTEFATLLNLMATARTKPLILRTLLPGCLVTLFSPHRNIRLWSINNAIKWISSKQNVPLEVFSDDGEPLDKDQSLAIRYRNGVSTKILNYIANTLLSLSLTRPPLKDGHPLSSDRHMICDAPFFVDYPFTALTGEALHSMSFLVALLPDDSNKELLSFMKRLWDIAAKLLQSESSHLNSALRVLYVILSKGTFLHSFPSCLKELFTIIVKHKEALINELKGTSDPLIFDCDDLPTASLLSMSSFQINFYWIPILLKGAHFYNRELYQDVITFAISWIHGNQESHNGSIGKLSLFSTFKESGVPYIQAKLLLLDNISKFGDMPLDSLPLSSLFSDLESTNAHPFLKTKETGLIGVILDKLTLESIKNVQSNRFDNFLTMMNSFYERGIMSVIISPSILSAWIRFFMNMPKSHSLAEETYAQALKFILSANDEIADGLYKDQDHFLMLLVIILYKGDCLLKRRALAFIAGSMSLKDTSMSLNECAEFYMANYPGAFIDTLVTVIRKVMADDRKELFLRILELTTVLYRVALNPAVDPQRQLIQKLFLDFVRKGSRLASLWRSVFTLYWRTLASLTDYEDMMLNMAGLLLAQLSEHLARHVGATELDSNNYELTFENEAGWFPLYFRLFTASSKIPGEKGSQLFVRILHFLKDVIYDYWLKQRVQIHPTTVSTLNLIATTSLKLDEMTKGPFNRLACAIEELRLKFNLNISPRVISNPRPLLVNSQLRPVNVVPIKHPKSLLSLFPKEAEKATVSTSGYTGKLAMLAQGLEKHPSKKLKVENSLSKVQAGTVHSLVSSESSEEDYSNAALFKGDQVESKPRLAERVAPSRPIQILNDPAVTARLKPSSSIGVLGKPTSFQLDARDFHKDLLHFDMMLDDVIPIRDSIPQSFSSASDYARTFMPFFIAEAKAQILKAKEESRFPLRFPYLKHVRPSLLVNAVLEQVLLVDDFHELTFRLEGINRNSFLPLSEHDYCLVECHQFIDSQEKWFTGIVTTVSVKQDILIKIQTHKPALAVQQSLRPGSGSWKFFKVTSLVTSYREFTALLGLPSIDLLPYILQPKKLVAESSSSLEIKGNMIAEKLKINSSQGLAVAASYHSSNPIVLVQGPPGTGKTTTIMSMVSYYFATKAAALPSGLTQSNVLAVNTLRRPRVPTLLIAAPSNAAVDEIVRRLLSGIADFNNPQEKWFPKVLRIGTMDMIHEDVKHVALEYLLEKELKNKKSGFGGNGALMDNLHARLAAIKNALDWIDASGTKGSMDPLLAGKSQGELMTIKREITSQLDALKNENKGRVKVSEDIRTETRTRLLQECDILCCTLSGTGHDALTASLAFDTVIVDESCQCVELSTLIPLRFGCKRLILVGDPNQLPPTVLSKDSAQDSPYSRSLFERIHAESPYLHVLLSVQYRMHPLISAFPSAFFYSGLLKDGSNTSVDTLRPWHSLQDPILSRPFSFVDIAGVHESGDSLTSLMNKQEALTAAVLVQQLCASCPKFGFSGRIGIITPYKQQVHVIRQELRNIFRKFIGQTGYLKHIEVNTVDGFQGQEKDIIIFSCVRATQKSGPTSIGFLADVRRLNVAITRAKSTLIVLGNAQTLNSSGSTLWMQLVRHAKNTNAFSTLTSKQMKAHRNSPILPNLTRIEK